MYSYDSLSIPIVITNFTIAEGLAWLVLGLR